MSLQNGFEGSKILNNVIESSRFCGPVAPKGLEKQWLGQPKEQYRQISNLLMITSNELVSCKMVD
jgi:hypothetical protein